MKRFLLVFLVGTCFLFSCRKEYSLQKFIISTTATDISYSEKTFSVNNQAALLLKTPTGLKIHFPPYAFVNKNGQPVTNNINIEIKEILKPDAMILHRMPTVSDGRPLESGGEFFIGVTSGNEKLQLAASVFIRLDLPGTGYSLDGMRVFNGMKRFSTGPDSINWVLNSNSGNIVTRLDSSMLSLTALFCDSINWINVDKIMPEQTIQFSIDPGNSPDIDSTIVYIHLSGRNSVIGGYKDASSMKFKASVIESEATIVGLCYLNGELYSSISATSLKRGQSATMSFAKTTEAQLKQKLKTLR